MITNNGKEGCSHQECIYDTENGSNCDLEVGFGHKTYDHVNSWRYNTNYNGNSAFNSKHKLESS